MVRMPDFESGHKSSNLFSPLLRGVVKSGYGARFGTEKFEGSNPSTSI